MDNLYILFLVGLLIVVLLSVGFVLLFNISKKRIISEINTRKQKELDYQKQLILNSVETQEKERNRIARELHDDIGSRLNVANLNLNLLENRISNDKKLTDTVSDVKEILLGSIHGLRELSHDLYPPVLDKFGLSAALEGLAMRVDKSDKIEVVYNSIALEKRFSKKEELNIYRIFQELVNNTIKHSGADLINIDIEEIEECIKFTYKDNGKGIEDSEKLFNGMGMKNLKTRALYLNTEFLIKNREPNGIIAEFKIGDNG